MKDAVRSMLALLAVAAVACGNDEPVDLGTHEVLGASLTHYEGSWEGYVEAYEFDDGSDTLRVRLDDQGNGTIEVGDSEPLPEPDPDLGWPPGNAGNNLLPTGAIAPYGVFAGFRYPIRDASIDDRRIRLSSSTFELYRDWCAAMTPVRDDLNSEQHGEDVYACLPNLGFSAGENGCSVGDEPIDCGKLACIGTCLCEADGCAISEPPPEDLKMDAALQSAGEELAGTLVIGRERLNVRLMRR